MLLFRSITVGLLGACVFMVAQLGGRSGGRPEPVVVTRPVIMEVPTSPVAVVDVAHGVPPSTVLSLVRIGPDEQIASVGDTEVENDLVAGSRLADAIRSGAQYVDLEVAQRDSPTNVRRVLILLH